MEDAMILNKSAFERGFGHGSIYKAEVREWTTFLIYFTKYNRGYHW
jgi:DNA-directed RNA polymerase beta subunit